MKKVLVMLLIVLVAVSGVFAQGTVETEDSLIEINVGYMPNYNSLCSIELNPLRGNLFCLL